MSISPSPLKREGSFVMNLSPGAKPTLPRGSRGGQSPRRSHNPTVQRYRRLEDSRMRWSGPNLLESGNSISPDSPSQIARSRPNSDDSQHKTSSTLSAAIPHHSMRCCCFFVSLPTCVPARQSDRHCGAGCLFDPIFIKIVILNIGVSAKGHTSLYENPTSRSRGVDGALSIAVQEEVPVSVSNCGPVLR